MLVAPRTGPQGRAIHRLALRGCLHNLLQDAKLRERFAGIEAPGFDVALFDALRDRALAAWYARERFVAAQRQLSSAKLPAQVVAQATEVRGRMLRVVQYYLPNNAEVREIRGGVGYTDLASDLSCLVQLYEGPMTGMPVDGVHFDAQDLGRAKTLFKAIINELTSQGNGDYETWQEQLARAFTLLRDTYDTIRAAALFVFRNEPLVQARFPSLFTASRKAGKRDDASDGAGGESNNVAGNNEGEQAPVNPSVPAEAVPVAATGT